MYADEEGSPIGIAKPPRLQKLEAYWQDSKAGTVKFDNGFAGEWMVYMNGHFADFEIKEIANALRAANKAGKL